jgi:beta-phosphoglucomutase
MTHGDRAVLWDLDGTLVDSRDQHWRAWRSAMAAEGITITERQFLTSFGQRNDAILTGWLGAQATPAFIARVGEEKERRFRELVGCDGVVLLPGVAHWVGSLGRTGWMQAIASSAPRLNVAAISRALAIVDRFRAIVSAEDVRHGKPDPEVFLVAAERLAVPPARCVVVEDAAAGIEAARRAGMRSIGVGGGVGDAADITIPSLEDLPADAFDDLLRRT